MSYRLSRPIFAFCILYATLAVGAPEAGPPAKMSLPQVLDRAVASDQLVAIADLEVRKTVLETLLVASRMNPQLNGSMDTNWQGSRTRNEDSTAPVALSDRGNGSVSPANRVVQTLVREQRWTRSRSNAQGLGLNLSQPILDLTVAHARKQSKLTEEIARWQLRERLREVLLGVAVQYVAVLRQEELITESRKTLGQTTELVRQAEGRLKAEEVIESDVLQARVSDEQARRALMEAEVGGELAKSQLAVALNYLPGEPFALNPLAEWQTGIPTLRDAISQAQSFREDIAVARLTVDRTEAERAEIRSRFAPRLDAQLGSDLALGSQTNRRESWSAGLSLSWDIFDRGQRMLELQANGIQKLQDGQRLEDTVRVVTSDVVEAWYRVDQLRKRLASLLSEKQAAEANYTVQEGRYKAGLATVLEVQTAMRDQAAARIDLVNARYDLEIAHRELANAQANFERPRIQAAMGILSSPAAR